jgi:hypothetical protein
LINGTVLAQNTPENAKANPNATGMSLGFRGNILAEANWSNRDQQRI